MPMKRIFIGIFHLQFYNLYRFCVNFINNSLRGTTSNPANALPIPCMISNGTPTAAHVNACSKVKPYISIYAGAYNIPKANPCRQHRMG